MNSIKNHVLTVLDNKKLQSLIDVIFEKHFSDTEFYKAFSVDELITTVSNNLKINLVILDNDSLIYNAFEILKRIKGINPKIGIIIISRDISKELSLKALNSGAYNLIPLDDNLEENVILCIRSFFVGIQNDKLNVEVIQFIFDQDITYKIPNSLRYIPIITHHLTRDLMQVGLINEERLEGVKLGLQEMMVNAIEHGNLEISFEKKSELLKDGQDLFDIIENYSKREEYMKKYVTVNFKLTREKATYKIKDEGPGFDWKTMIKNIYDLTNASNIFIEHGRGIIMAKKYFDEFSYNDKGNEVTLVILKKGTHQKS